MRALVTGGAGFIGSNLVRSLCDRGHDVVVVDDLSSGYAHLVDRRARFEEASFDDPSALGPVLADTDVVFHMAAISTVQVAFERPVDVFENNVVRGVRLLELMRKHGTRHLVFSSSASVYGEPPRIPVHEDDPKRPTQLYGGSKLAFEALLSAYYEMYGINSTSFRYFNAFGPNDLQRPVTRAVPRWIRAALRGDPIVLYWNGAQFRDYVYVDDIVEAHLLAMQLPGYRQYNLGSGQGIRMRDLATEILAMTGSHSALTDGGSRQGDPHRLVAGIRKVQADLGWVPRMPRDEGLRRTISFFRESPHLRA